MENQLKTWALKFIQNKPCNCGRCFGVDSMLLSVEELVKFQRGFQGLSPQDQELYIITLLQEARQPSLSKLVRPRGETHERIRLTLKYHIYPFGRVCRSVFRKLFGLSDKKLRNLFAHLQTSNFPCLRNHGNTGRPPKHTLPPEQRHSVENWIINFAMRIGEPNWRTISPESDVHLIFLPACYTISMLHALCLEDIGNRLEFSFSRSTFYSILRSDACKHVRISNPRTDMCNTCDLLKKTLTSMAQQYREEKEPPPLPAVHLANHLSLARAAREDYKNDQKKARKGNISHFSYDYSQNLVLPQKADQPGAFYFFSLRNVYLFGINDESCNRQMNYLIDESECSKGSNDVISMIWHFLSSLPQSKRLHIIFNADNCIGQNKNNTMVKFFLWQCLMGYSQTIQVKFMIQGHTHFGPDSNFSHIKRRYRRSNAFCIENLATTIQDSSATNEVEILDHTHFFDFRTGLDQYFDNLPGISNFHYFLFDVDKPGIISVKEHLGDKWSEYLLLKSSLKPFNAKLCCTFKPSPLAAPGMRRSKQIELYEKVRRYVPDEFKDALCPKPIDYIDKGASTEHTVKSTIKKRSMSTGYSTKQRRPKASKEELAILNDVFVKTAYPSSTTIAKIAEELNWNTQSVKVWFNNKRFREKKALKENIT